MKGRNPTKQEKEFMGCLVDLGCIVCLKFHDVYTPCSPHHVDGKTRTGSHFRTIGLCSRHHQIPDNNKPKRWISRHGDGRFAFESKYGTEKSLMDETREILQKWPEN